MDFKFSDEQQQLRDTLQRFLRKEYAFDARGRILASPEGFSREVWRELAHLGVLGIGLPEEHGGLGGTGVDTLIVMESFGNSLVVEPYLSTVVLCGALLRDAANATPQAEAIAAIAGGEALFALAHDEAHSRYELHHVATTARKSAGGYVIDGAKIVVLHGDSADRLIVSARTAGAVDDEDGLSLFVVDAKAPGITRHGYATHDGQRAADIVFEEVSVGPETLIGTPGRAAPILERAIDAAIAALCAEAIGCMDALNLQTLEYLKTRKQFGVAIGTFQVLKHRMADMFIAAAQARSMAYLAAMRAFETDRATRRRAMCAAKALVGRAARSVGQEAVQLHGGMGVTEELAVSHYFKRLTAINATFGDAEHHLARFSDQIVAPAASAAAAPAASARARQPA